MSYFNSGAFGRKELSQLISNPFFEYDFSQSVTPPPGDSDFLLLDGTPMLLLDNTNFLLLE